MTIIPYTGNSDYCYAHSLHMALLSAGAHPHQLPNPGFLECLTTMPFGKMYLQLEDGPLAFFSNPNIDPDAGLTLALQSLGWTCQEQRGSEDDAALDRLREATKHAPALVGPLDLAYLTYNPIHTDLAGGDHFVLVLSVEADHILLHDPWKYPYAYLPIPDFMSAWRAENIAYRIAPYTMRSHFQQIEQRTRQQMITHILPIIKANLLLDQQGPIVYSGVHALHRLINNLRSAQPPIELLNNLRYFILPLASRRSLDASAFLLEAANPQAAACMQQQAIITGQAQYHAVQGQWPQVADLLGYLAEVEQQLIASI